LPDSIDGQDEPVYTDRKGVLGVNNEDKILTILEKMDTRLDKLEQGQLEIHGEIGALSNEMGSLSNEIGTLSNEMGSLRTDMASLNTRVDKLSQDMDAFAEGLEVVKKSVLITEQVHYPRIQAALDGFVAASEHNEWQDQRIQAVEETVQRHDIELFVLKEAIG